MEEIGRVERSGSLVEFSIWKREQNNILIRTCLCKYSDAELSINIRK